MTTVQKIEALRKVMQENKIDAFVVFSADPHMSEYLPEEWQERSWLTGFTGSAGFAVITLDKAALWTDGRYFVQAENELKNTGIALMKMGELNTPAYEDWLLQELKENMVVALDAQATAHIAWENLHQKLSSKQIHLVDKPLLKDIWKNRISQKPSPLFIHSEKWAGISATEKIKNIRAEMENSKADLHIITALDDVAWTLNLRGKDVEYNPVFLGYILIGKEETILFVNPLKITPEIEKYLSNHNVKVENYDNFFSYLSRISGKKIIVSAQSNQAIFGLLQQENTILTQSAPGNLMKAQKNEKELEGFRIAMKKDGVAMVKFLHWLDTNVGATPMDEYSVGVKLREFREEGENFVGESFGSIVGYKNNGAVIHYSAKEEGSNSIVKDGSLLIDSGGQYLEGTTDITRTVALGKVSKDFKKNWTLVLKGMIQLSMARFPNGTKGLHLDAIARLPLWKEQKDYNHGTGHGVGSFLNVHEGPQNIRKDINLQNLLPGMVCSNEPGYYVEDEYGIRLENLVAVTRISEKFMEFETLTICPFDTRLLVVELLTSKEKEWFNAYQKWCKESLENELDTEVKDWLIQATQTV